ncbi:hypothetical protein KUCAC02_011722 [Chaenocephalus aceratus]|uniref:Uncharacterized protein n=1 Tax=Chaenocephalus aceratus TaxID=36190 RepID=A0ACB9WY84_CHAAC|nr:hypothetical protein KUCAC02_011722 [Chaenocephalus aceratus]
MILSQGECVELPQAVIRCGNAAARWSVSGSLSRTDLLKTLLAGLEKEEDCQSYCHLHLFSPLHFLTLIARYHPIPATDRHSALGSSTCGNISIDRAVRD